MPELDPDHLADLRAHSIASWPRIYVACGFAAIVTFVSTLLLGSVPMWNAVTGVGILFSIIAMNYVATVLALTTYFETRARHDFANSLFGRSILPLDIFILKEALEPRTEDRSK